MSEQGSISQWIDEMREGNSLAAHHLWTQYYQKLIQLARRKLRDLPRRVADEEDIIVDAFNSFLAGAQGGRFPDLSDRDDLWQVLVMLTARKAANQIKFNFRQKRGGGRVRGESIFSNLPEEDRAGIDQIVGSEPTPEFADQCLQQYSDLLDLLDDEVLQKIAVEKMQGYSNQEIAASLNVTPRTIERKLKVIREIWTAKE